MYRTLAKLLSLAFDNLDGRCVYGYKKFLDNTQWMKREDLQRLRLKRLKALLRHAYDNVPYYHDAFKEVNFRPADFRSLDDLHKLPVLKKATMRKRLDCLKARNLTGKKMTTWLTSGTTASPVKVYRSKEDLSWGVASELRGFEWAGYEPGDKHGLLWIVHSHKHRGLQLKLKNLLMRNIMLDISSISEKSMASFARKMHILKPQFLRGYSSAMSIFATFVSQNGGCEIRPSAIFTSACNLLPHYRRVIENTFNCKVYDYYASVEVPHIAAQCGYHDGLHTSEENVIVEIAKDDSIASPGEEGKVLITNLQSYAMPFIRYDIGDTAKSFSDDCVCGRELSLLKPTGRTYEYFVDDKGSFTTLRDFQTVFEDLPIKDFQVVQESYDHIVIKIAPRPDFTKAHSEFILKHVKSHGTASVHVQLVDSIPMERSGKIRHMVSKIPSKYSRVMSCD